MFCYPQSETAVSAAANGSDRLQLIRIPTGLINRMTPQQNTELRRALVALESSVKSLETQNKLLVDGQRELRGKVDRLLYAMLGIGTAVIAAMVISQVLG